MSESSIRAYAAGKGFGAPLLQRWLALPEADGAAVLDLAAALRLGENQVRDVLDDLLAIAARCGRGPAEVLGGAELAAIHARGLGRNEAVRAVKLALRRLRYPQLSAAEQQLAEQVKAMRLPAGVRVELPENLEGEHIAVVLRGRSAAELRAQADAVAAALRQAPLDAMFDLLGGSW